MSREEFVNGYLGGRIDRRMFVRGLIATGVSLTAAVAYSEALGGAIGVPGARPRGRAFYDPDPGEGTGPKAVSAEPRVTG